MPTVDSQTGGLVDDAARQEDSWNYVVILILAPDPYQGKPLAGPYKGLYRFRVGEYRIVDSIEKKRLVVLVLRIRHRKDVYRGLV